MEGKNNESSEKKNNQTHSQLKSNKIDRRGPVEEGPVGGGKHYTEVGQWQRGRGDIEGTAEEGSAERASSGHQEGVALQMRGEDALQT